MAAQAPNPARDLHDVQRDRSVRELQAGPDEAAAIPQDGHRCAIDRADVRQGANEIPVHIFGVDEEIRVG